MEISGCPCLPSKVSHLSNAPSRRPVSDVEPPAAAVKAAAARSPSEASALRAAKERTTSATPAAVAAGSASLAVWIASWYKLGASAGEAVFAMLTF